VFRREEYRDRDIEPDSSFNFVLRLRNMGM